MAERERQEQLDWHRGKSHWYEELGRYQVASVLEHTDGASLLDLACGDGVLTAQLAPHFDRVVGVDASNAHLDKARRACPGAEFHCSLIEEWMTTERFDTITLLNILEHVVNPVAVLRQARGWLAEDGIIIAQVPNARAINRRLGVLMGVLDDLYKLSEWDITVAGHRHYFDAVYLHQAFDLAGLNVIKEGGIFFKMFSTNQIDWLLEWGLWDSDAPGWGSKRAFLNACYEIGKERPEDCNLIYAVGVR